MARTTSELVEGLLSDDYDGESSLTVHVTSAYVMVNRVVTCATNKGITLSDEELELIERWLAAHFYASVDQPYEEKETAAGRGKSRGKFQGKTAMYLEGTKYGQNAMALDYSGCLSAIASGKKRVARVDWLGKPPSEQIDYDDRD
jgi:hypothetical protein